MSVKRTIRALRVPAHEEEDGHQEVEAPDNPRQSRV